MLISCSSLWTYFDCKDGEKTRVYLERSKSSPIDLCLYRREEAPSYDSLSKIIPHAAGRLKLLFTKGTPKNIPVITSLLSHPAPRLENLWISAGYRPRGHAAITSSLFNGDLSSLRTLLLEFVRTELPWRNMVNLTSLTLSYTPPGAISFGQLLDFFESAPYLRKVVLRFATPTTGVQRGRLVSLAYLKTMDIDDDCPSSLLLDHLLVPVGAELVTWGNDPVSSLIGEVFPRSLGNLKNLTHFTAIHLCLTQSYIYMKFSGPNGRVGTTFKTSRADPTNLLLDFLAQLDTSKTGRLESNSAGIRPGTFCYHSFPWQTCEPSAIPHRHVSAFGNGASSPRT